MLNDIRKHLYEIISYLEVFKIKAKGIAAQAY